ncbi:MAG: DNRLRE domain-containing protein [Bacteroidota bacterium]
MNIIRALPFLLFTATQLFGQVISVELIQSDGNWSLNRGGNPYYIEGAGGSDFLGKLAEYGGNSIRTWGTGEDTQVLLDSAHSLGLTVCMGLWVGHQEHGFDYDDETAVANQFAEFKKWVERYKDHPAVLFWALGNEVELGVSYSSLNLKVWDAINDLSEMVHEIDGNHPTLTITAGLSGQKLADIKERAPDLDILGVNCYGCIGGVENTIDQGGWNKPYMITEWGPNGQWESPRTSWGATIELTSTQKAQLYFDRYANAILSDADKVIGSYVFLWGNKFEETPTWYGLFFDGSETEAVDMMTYHWSGSYPENRAPKIISAKLNGKFANENVIIRADGNNEITLEVEDENMESLTFEYLIQPEIGSDGTVSDGNQVLPYIPGLFSETQGAEGIFKTPENLKNYRLFYFVRDDDGNIGLGNIPFRVELDPLVSTDPTIFFASRDAYVRDGEFQADDFGDTDFGRLITRLSENEDQGFIRETYVGFDLSSIDESMNSATVELYGGGTAGVKTVIYGIGDLPWSEKNLSWNTKYDDSQLVALDTMTIGSEETYYKWNVKDYVIQQLATGKDQLSFVFKNISVHPQLSIWDSRETRPNPPRMVFDFNGEELVLSNNHSIERSLKIYPVPTHDLLKVQTDSYILEYYEISTLNGKIIKSGRFTDYNKEIDLSLLSSGVYGISIYSRHHVFRNKLYVK